MDTEVARQHIQEKRKGILRDIDQKLDRVFEDLLDEISKFSLNNFDIEKLFKDPVKKPRQKVAANGKNDKEIDRLSLRMKLPEKVFEPRNSLLTDLFEIKHIKTVYHIFIVILIYLFLNTMVTDFVAEGKINIGLAPIVYGFGGFHIALGIWCIMQLSTLALFPVFMFWGKTTKKHFLKRRGFLTTLWNFSWILITFVYQMSFTIFFTKAVLYFDLRIASSIAVLMELTRFLMKTHAFIRTNVPRVLYSNDKMKVDKENEAEDEASSDETIENIVGTHKVNDKRIFPTFQKYVYFLFAPTLVYRDEYPRTKVIRWKVVFNKYAEVAAVIFYMSFIFEQFMYPKYQSFGQSQEIHIGQLVLSIFTSTMPGLLAFLCGFYCILHSWMNAAAEILRFSDRMFYKDWWNSTSFAVYYRTWNIIVHDWLYLYVYKDFYEHVLGQSRLACQFTVFTISALFHEYILAFSFRFCYPVMFLMFEGFGVLLLFVTKKEHKALGNIFMWLSLALGMGIMLSLYHMEFYARKNCDIVTEEFNSEIWNYFVPVSWKCNKLIFNTDWKIQVHL